MVEPSEIVPMWRAEKAFIAGKVQAKLAADKALQDACQMLMADRGLDSEGWAVDVQGGAFVYFPSAREAEVSPIGEEE